MIRRLRLSDRARQDLKEIWLYTAKNYDDDQADAYDSLLWQALRDIEENPERPSSKRHPELGESIGSNRIALSRERSGTRIRSPRHVVSYTLRDADEVYVLRILHAAMDPTRHLTEE